MTRTFGNVLALHFGMYLRFTILVSLISARKYSTGNRLIFVFDWFQSLFQEDLIKLEIFHESHVV